MTFDELARYLEKLEQVSSRLEMTRILAELFSKVDAQEGKVVAYLSGGKLGPKYDSPDTGVAEKQVIKSIKLLGESDVEKVFKQEGDLGKTVERIKQELNDSDNKNSKSEIDDVYKNLLKIAQASGEGSQEEKIKLLSNLMDELSPREAKYVVKIILGKMRTGFSDMTVLDSLSWMIRGDKSLRNEIERVYNVRADLGEVVKLVKQSGEKIKNMTMTPDVGTPILVARAERAKSPAEIWERNGISAAEHKLDGLRIQAHVKKDQVKLFSRGLDNVTSMYPDIVDGLKNQVHKECILDGEMIAVDKNGRYLPFQETVQRKRKYDILEMMSKVPLKYYVFDLLLVEGESLIDEPNEKRWKKLEQVVDKGEVVRLMPREIVRSETEIEKFFRASLKEGTEGIVVKKLDGVYRSGSRDFNWIKYKKSYDESGVADTIDAVVMGYDVGQGKRSGFGIGGFLIGVQKGNSDKYLTIAKIGTGLTDEEWKELNARCLKIRTLNKLDSYEVTKQMECDVWVEPKIVVEIKCDEITKSPMHTAGYALRFPRLVEFREMKVEDIASEKEIERLYKLQETDRQKGGGVSEDDV